MEYRNGSIQNLSDIELKGTINETFQMKNNNTPSFNMNVLQSKSSSLELIQQDTSSIDDLRPDQLQERIYPEIPTQNDQFLSDKLILEIPKEKEAQGEKKIFKLISLYIDVPKKSQSKQLRNNFSTEIRNILKEWIIAHAHHPYPNQFEIVSLISKTHLTKKQILVWMTNNRARILGRSPKNGKTNSSKTNFIYPMK